MGIGINGKVSAIDDIVFYYDVDDINSYKGEPTVNLANTSGGTIDWTFIDLGAAVITREILENGKKYRFTSTVGGGLRIIFNLSNLTNGETYTLSFKYKIISGATFTYNDWNDTSLINKTTIDYGDYVYESGTGTRATYDSTYRFADFNMSSDTMVEVWDLQLELKDYATPFTQTERTATESLYPSIGNTNLDLTNMSYSNGKPIFNGSTDYIDLGSDVTLSPLLQGWTAEYIFKTNSASTPQHFNSSENDTPNSDWLAIFSSKLAIWDRTNSLWLYGSTTLQNDTWYQATFVCDPNGTNYRFYINGVREGGSHDGHVFDNSNSELVFRYIGRYEHGGSYSRYFNGEIPIVRAYNRPLTDSEIYNNFLNIKTRFNIS